SLTQLSGPRASSGPCCYHSADYDPADSYTLSLHDALPILRARGGVVVDVDWRGGRLTSATLHATCDTEVMITRPGAPSTTERLRSEEHTSELQSRENLVCRLLLGKKNL